MSRRVTRESPSTARDTPSTAAETPAAKPIDLAQARVERATVALDDARASLRTSQEQLAFAEKEIDEVGRTPLRLQVCATAREDVFAAERLAKRRERELSEAKNELAKLQRAAQEARLEVLKVEIRTAAQEAQHGMAAVVDADRVLDKAVLSVVGHVARAVDAYREGHRIAITLGLGAEYQAQIKRPDLVESRELARTLVCAARVEEQRDSVEEWLRSIEVSSLGVSESQLAEGTAYSGRAQVAQDRAAAIERDRRLLGEAFAMARERPRETQVLTPEEEALDRQAAEQAKRASA